jgi:histidinol-phosphatase (PHP family)
MSQFIDYTYHSHTARCGHARGTDEEYALAAIKGGYKILGYSDHVMLPGIHQEGMRGDYSLLEDYKKSVRDLQGKYQKQLQIYLAFETEWYYSHFADYYRDLLSKQGFDYLLLGQHCFLMDGDRPVFYGQMKDNATALRMYTSDLIAGMHSGLFLYVCHPDLFREWYPSRGTSWPSSAPIASSKPPKSWICPLEVNSGLHPLGVQRSRGLYPHNRPTRMGLSGTWSPKAASG